MKNGSFKQYLCLKKYLCLAIVLIPLISGPLISGAAQAENMLEKGLKAGNKMPVELSLPDQSGLIKSFEDLTGTNGLILIFARSTSWCPYCQKQLIEWSAHTLRFQGIGYNIAALTYDPVTQQRSFARENNVVYPVLSDKGSSVIMAFGLLNESYDPDSQYHGIPHPAIYVISPDGQITHRFSEQGYKLRPQIEDIYQTLKPE